jgi:hypothetical protein
MKFKYNCLSQTQLGKLFGKTSHEIGEILSRIGLRDPSSKSPTQDAHFGKFCEKAPSGQYGYHYVWNAEKTVPRIVENGYPLELELPTDICEPPFLNGPFRLSSTNPKCVLSADGTLAGKATTQKNAQVLLKLLSQGYHFGLERLMPNKIEPSTRAV